MNMQTDTTAHLTAEGAEIPVRAAAAMREMRAKGKIFQVPAAATEEPNTGQYDLKHEEIAPPEAPSLAALLAKRNAMMDAVNLRAEGDDAPDDEVTQANEAAFAVEHEILTSPCRTADDTVAKVAALVEFIREAGCPDESDIENVLADISRVLRESTHPMHGTKVDRRDAHWALVPHAPVAEPAPLNLPGDLAAIVAAAEDYDVKFVKPAVARHGAADVATMGEGKDDPALKRAETLAWDEMDNHCDVYRAIVDTILDHRPATPKELLNQVEAWGSLLVKHFAWRTNAETLIGKLSMEDAIMIGEHMHASLQGMLGTDGVSPTPPCGPNTPLAEAVAIRDKARAAFWVNEDPDLGKDVTKAEFAVFAVPATSVAEVLWKHGENMMEDKGANSHADGVEQTEAEGGLEAAAAVGVYRDLERLAAAQRQSIIIAALDAKLTELYAVERQLGAAEGDAYDEVAYEAAVAKSGPIAHALMASPARTLQDFQAKARTVQWACSSDWNAAEGRGTALDFMLMLVRELLGEAPSPTRHERIKSEVDADVGPAREQPDQAFWDKFAEHREALAEADSIYDAEGAEASEKDDSAYLKARDRAWDTCIEMVKMPVTTATAIVRKYFTYRELHDGLEPREIAAKLDAAYDAVALPFDDEDLYPALIADIRRLADLEVLGQEAGADDELIDDIAATISLNMQAMQATLPGAQTDLLDAADAPLQRALGMTARTLTGLAARASLVETWLPNGNFREDLEWRVVQSLIRDVRAICGVPEHVSVETSLEALERRIDRAIVDIPLLAGGKHGLTDDEFNKRLADGDELVAAIVALDGDDPVTQRLRIKALGWLSDYSPTVVVKGADAEEQLLTALMRSACKQSPPPACMQRAPELLAAE